MGFIVFIVFILFYLDYQKYENSLYKHEVNLPYQLVRFNKGAYGEYLIFSELEGIKGYSKIKGNLYIPKGSGTTEIDTVFIHETGIYVIESKNFSGWIFGSENQRNWTQTFPNGKKYRFYNPIWQNNTHITHLKKLLSDVDPKSFKSIIVFGRKSTLKKINKKSNDVFITHSYQLMRTMKATIKESSTRLSPNEIDGIYNELKKYTNASDFIKNQHIGNIKGD